MQYKPKHDKKYKPHYSVTVFRVAALLACLVLITTYLLSGAYSKFYTSAYGGDSARVAHFSPKFTSTGIFIENQLPGYSAEIPFTVQNTSDDKESEVAMKYKIVLKTTGNIPLKFTVCKIDGSNSKEFNCDGMSGEHIYEYTDGSFVFGVGTNEEDKYSLKIKWENTKNDARFSGMTDAVYLSAEFEQID